MRRFSNADFLAVWERGARMHPLDQGLLLLSAALPETPSESLADWQLGRRNQALAQLRCECFGPHLQGWLRCRNCGEKMEFAMDCHSLTGRGTDGEPLANEPINVRGCSFRLPTSRDLVRVARGADARTAPIRLLEFCRVGGGEFSNWTEEDEEQVGQAMAMADPMAETLVRVHCPSCDSESDETLDIVAFLWKEIEGRARRLLWEIHVIASVYGWTEKEILSLSDVRRGIYIEMAQQ